MKIKRDLLCKPLLRMHSAQLMFAAAGVWRGMMGWAPSGAHWQDSTESASPLSRPQSCCNQFVQSSLTLLPRYTRPVISHHSPSIYCFLPGIYSSVLFAWSVFPCLLHMWLWFDLHGSANLTPHFPGKDQASTLHSDTTHLTPLQHPLHCIQLTVLPGIIVFKRILPHFLDIIPNSIHFPCFIRTQVLSLTCVLWLRI